MELVSRLLGLCLAAEHLLPDIRLPGFSAMGRHSLLIYLLHQPVLYALLVLLPTFL